MKSTAIELADEVRVTEGRYKGRSGLVVDDDVLSQKQGCVRYMKVLTTGRDKVPLVVVESHLERLERVERI